MTFLNKNNKWLAYLALLISSCAIAPHEQNREKLLPEIDVLQMKENSETALQLTRQMKHEMNTLSTRLGDLESKFLDLNNTIKTMPLARMEEFEGRMVTMNEDLISLRKMMVGKSNKKSFHPRGEKTKVAIPDRQPPKFRRAMQEYQKQKFNKAIQLFEKYLTEYPKGAWSDDAFYWLGESYYQTGDYARGITFFHRVFQFKSSDKADDAQFRIGMSYRRLGDRNQATAELKKLEVIFPDSEYISRAKLELHKLNVPE